jgi:hypothetical protein
MATVHFRNAYFWLNGVDLSSHFAELTLNYGSETLDETAFGDTVRTNKGGLITWSLSGRAHQDFGAGAVDATLFSLVGTTTCFELRPHNTCSTTINPRYDGIGVLSNYSPLGGAVGTLLDTPFELGAASTLNRAVNAT